MAELKDKLITVESAKVIYDSLNNKFDDVVYSDELDSLMQNLLYSDESNPEADVVPVDADSLGGTPASEYATKGYVTTAINEALGVIENGTY